MPNKDFDKFLKQNGKNLPSPIAVIFAEDNVELDGTIQHHLNLGFATILVIGEVSALKTEGVQSFSANLNQAEDSIAILNQIVKACRDKWIYYCFNAEYLYFPFCETRTIKDALAFMEEERRAAVFTYAVDLYPDNLSEHANGVNIDTAHLDRSGHYGMERFQEGKPLERQYDIFGGLRWRFEEHIPWEKRRIDRISLFKASKGLEVGPDLLLNEPELNTVSCKWHHNMTMAVMSFRVAKALMHNPGSADEIETFHWGGSEKFEWNSRQLMELGFMEPGQWF